MSEDDKTQCSLQRVEIANLRAEIASLTRPAQVLVVEDEAGDRDAFFALTRNHDLILEFAKTASSARELVHSKKYDFVFVDQKLPDGDGVSFFQWMRESQIDSDVIILSGYIDRDLATKSASIGFAPLVMKPDAFTPDYFDCMMRTLGIRRKKPNAS